MVNLGQVPEEQLLRQRSWLGDSWTWLLRTMVLDHCLPGAPRPTALDVGCGPGLVMELLSPYMDIRGVDIDPKAVRASNLRGMDATIGDAERLPYKDGSFDIVYCSYLLLWVRDPERVVREMARVSREWVICLAEPDHMGRISFPDEVAALDRLLVSAMREQGADPGMGRKLPGLFARCSLKPVAGVHANMWRAGMAREEMEGEWYTLTAGVDPASLSALRDAWEHALMDGSLVQYNPVFYAIARK